MHHIAKLAIAMALLAGPAVAQCDSAGDRVRCTFTAPGSTGYFSTDTDRDRIGARFISVIRTPTDGDRPVTPRVGRVVWPLPQTPGPADHVLQKGETLPAEVLILIDPTRYGLPRPRDGWTYFQLGRDIYRAEMRTRRVLNYVNPHIAGY